VREKEMKQVGCLCLLLVVLIVPIQVAAGQDEPERDGFLASYQFLPQKFIRCKRRQP
jgi:hypothetical protein